MKKLIALLLALCLVFAMAACGESEPAPAEDETAAPTASTDGTDITGGDSPAAGTVVGNTYSNSFIGITCELGSGWRFADAEEIAALNNISLEAMQMDPEIVAKASYFYDMMAQNSSTGASIGVIMENIGLQALTMGVDDYMDAGIEQMHSAFGNMGFQVTKAEKTTYDFAGSSYDGIDIVVDMGGTTFYETQIVIKRGAYIVSITFGAFDAQELNDMMQVFKAL